MPDRIIISDTSSLIALTNIGELNLLKKVYKEIVITPEIAEEYGIEVPDWIKIKQVSDPQKFKLINLELDKGESSGIALALESNSCLLIIDEIYNRQYKFQRHFNLGSEIEELVGLFHKYKKCLEQEVLIEVER
ncbi:DUF3368 domain-containing protein [Lunatibacter salilacus]|uniref:DUF3368 domain-containing protein n=1 Tax=Lunatibacter salilacus TaxID=2483804 RepID=UPI00131B3704|nr:DUF3368 domain-containing protein [Lunatibacter salilacus]